MKKEKLVIFDFDGVLVNTKDLVFRIHKKVNPDLTREGLEALEIGNFHENYKKALSEGTHVHNENFLEEYGNGVLDLSTNEALNRLILDLHQNYNLIVCSSTDSKYIKNRLTKENVLSCFCGIYGSDIHTSKVIKINKALGEMNIEPKNAIFITDTVGDIQEGKACNVKSIAVTWGNHGRDYLIREEPFSIVDSIEELEKEISRFFAH